MIVDEFAELHAAAAETPLVMSVVLHSFISGVPFRLRAVGRALERIAGARGRLADHAAARSTGPSSIRPELFGTPGCRRGGDA